MTKSKLILLAAVMVLMSLSSCGLFKKSCNCPHFGKIELPDVRMCKYTGVQMMG
jgi:thiol:disulfide interchange protein